MWTVVLFSIVCSAVAVQSIIIIFLIDYIQKMKPPF